MRSSFVPTHKLKENIPELKLVKGMLLRQVNPFGERDLLCYTQEEWEQGCCHPWILSPGDIEPLPEWKSIQKEMIKDISLYHERIPVFKFHKVDDVWCLTGKLGQSRMRILNEVFEYFHRYQTRHLSFGEEVFPNDFQIFIDAQPVCVKGEEFKIQVKFSSPNGKQVMDATDWFRRYLRIEIS